MTTGAQTLGLAMIALLKKASTTLKVVMLNDAQPVGANYLGAIATGLTKMVNDTLPTTLFNPMLEQSPLRTAADHPNR